MLSTEVAPYPYRFGGDDRRGGSAAAAASAAAGGAGAGAGDDSDDDRDDGINIELERQRADRFRGWASAIDDMPVAASNKPTPLTRLMSNETATRFNTGEPKFCKTLDDHAVALAAQAAASAAAAASGEPGDADF